MSVDRRLFALAAVDVTGDHVDELVACAWDGYTCVVDHAANVVEYEFGCELVSQPNAVVLFYRGSFVRLIDTCSSILSKILHTQTLHALSR